MQTIGERLEEARKRKGTSIREAAEATKIRGDYLQKFESNQFDIGLSELYVRGFLRTYASYLKIPSERLVSDYRALAPTSNEKPRTPSREIYGRMDLSIASASGSSKAKDDDLPPPAPEPSGEQSGGARPRTFARIGTSLPDMPVIDGRQLMRIGAIVGGLVLVALVIWGVKSLVSGGEPSRIQASSMVDDTCTLIALDTVRVKVVQANDKTELFQGTLARGETRVLPKRGPITVTYSEAKNLNIDYKGKRYEMPTPGYAQATLP